MNQISVAMSVTLTNMSLYYTASKRILLPRRMMSADPPGIMLFGFFHEKHLLAIAKYIMVIPRLPTLSHCEQVKHLMRNQ